MPTSHNLQYVCKQQNLLDVGFLARKAVLLYPRTAYTDRAAVNSLRRGWIRQVQYLGAKWLLHPANRVLRRQTGSITPDAVVFTVVVAGSILSLFVGGGV